MSIQPSFVVTGPAGVTDLTVIEGIDLNAEIPCAAAGFCFNDTDHPAVYLVREWCYGCSALETNGYCRPAWVRAGLVEILECEYCGDEADLREDVMRIVEVLR